MSIVTIYLHMVISITWTRDDSEFTWYMNEISITVDYILRNDF